MNYTQYWNKIHELKSELDNITDAYWRDFSSFNSWQFWVVLALLIIPLVILLFTVDRSRIFEILFYGYTVHVLWGYISNALEVNNYFIHTYYLTPHLPSSLSMNASVLPISFLLLYQYCTNRNKNFYVYVLLISVIFAFGISFIEEMLGLVKFHKGFNRIYLILIDITIAYIAYWLTKFFIYLKNKPKSK